MIGILGLNHKSAPIELREKLVFCEEDIRRFVPFLQVNGVEGAIVLSTCNRTEIYFETETEDEQATFYLVEKSLLQYRKLPADATKHFYHKSGEMMVNHIFTVVSGLDSMVLGEYQIVGQLKEAICSSQKFKLMTPVLERLVNKAFETGKKVRNQTGMNKGAMSISYAAIELIARKLNGIQDKSALLIGAGQTGELTIQNLIRKNCLNLSVINRTFEKAQELAAEYDANAYPFEQMEDLLHEQDIVISSTASKKALIDVDLAKRIMQKRNGRPMYFVDLSVPRNIEHEVDQIDGVSVFDIDQLQGVVERNISEKEGKIQQANEIIQENSNEFLSWLDQRNLVPTFQAIAENFSKIHQSELQGFKKNEVQIDYQKATEYGEHITNKFVRLLIKNVKTVTDNGKKQEYINMVNELFDLSKS